MNDQQYYNGGYTKPGTLNKSTIAAMSRENLNLNQGPQRRMEPKHLQQPRPRSAVGLQYRQEHPDLIKDYGQSNGAPNGHPHSFQPDDQLRRSQGTNTKHQQQREFQIQNSPQMNGRSSGNNSMFRNSADQSSAPQNRDLIMHKQKSVNSFNLESQTTGETEKRPRPRSRGVSANSSAIELINMNYNSIQNQLERSLRPPSRMQVEDGSPTTKDAEQSLNSSTGRKTPYDFSQTLPVDDSRTDRNPGRMSQAEIIRNRNMSASRQTPVEPPHLRKSRTEEPAPGYQYFTQDKVSPIIPIPKKRHEDPPRPLSERNPDHNVPLPRARIPPHEKNSRMSKDGADQLRKPRTDADVVIQRNPPPHMNTRKEPMGAESVPVQRPATSMGFVRSSANKQNKDQEQQLNVRQKLELLQRRKSGGTSLEASYKEFIANNDESPQARPDSRGQRPPSGVKENRRRSYTTSTPAKSEDRLHPKATEKIRQTDGRTSRTSSDSSSSKDQSKSSRTNIVAPVSRVPPSGPVFGDRSSPRWKEIEHLSSESTPEQHRNGRRQSRGDYPFFLDFSKSTPEVTSSLDSLNREVSDHLDSKSRPRVNGDSGNTLSAIPKDSKLTMEDLDVQGTPQLSSPVDFNPDGSSNEDLDLEVRTLLGHSENGADTLDMALYQKLINGAVHKKICVLRDRSYHLDKKDNDLKSKRERLQRRMQQTLAKTTAMLNKSVELERSRVQVDLDVMDPSKAEELAVIQALSSTVRPKTPSGSSGMATRPQHTTERHIRKHDVRPTQHDVRPNQYDVRPLQHDVRTAQHDQRVEPPPYPSLQVSVSRREKEEYV
ncbi:hypothetical protein LOTGIDRAFT_235600 [Lottia gigantea]|uniref:Uncharacterized protein n=1 Tax=Lottia gigantea TaxID=225164 RepID=V3ZNW4_LOTGI|nr:hypothetical protein LOTGIDRAFT_235600 [Lottia gigantea]ESO86002.1 hypothetical protein LOTGIDRAFT_235600 [Lottia gigantea]